MFFTKSYKLKSRLKRLNSEYIFVQYRGSDIEFCQTARISLQKDIKELEQMGIGFLFVGIFIIEVFEIYFGVFLAFCSAYSFYQLVQKRKEYQQKRKDWLIRFSSIGEHGIGIKTKESEVSIDLNEVMQIESEIEELDWTNKATINLITSEKSYLFIEFYNKKISPLEKNVDAVLKYIEMVVEEEE